MRHTFYPHLSCDESSSRSHCSGFPCMRTYCIKMDWSQAMFTAMGVGFSNSLPSAAALNWVLKDGLGRLSRCIYTASLASAFDTNLKVF